MKVYLQSKQDWIDFVNGLTIVAYKNPIENCFKSILVGFNEVEGEGINTVAITKKY